MARRRQTAAITVAADTGDEVVPGWVATCVVEDWTAPHERPPWSTPDDDVADPDRSDQVAAAMLLARRRHREAVRTWAAETGVDLLTLRREHQLPDHRPAWRGDDREAV